MNELTPKLELQSTVNHPNDPAVVLGFMARDTELGCDGLVLKREYVPESNTEGVLVPTEVIEARLGNGGLVYVLGDDEVAAFGFPEERQNGLEEQYHHQFDETVKFSLVPPECITTWDRNEVTVE